MTQGKSQEYKTTERESSVWPQWNNARYQWQEKVLEINQHAVEQLMSHKRNLEDNKISWN